MVNISASSIMWAFVKPKLKKKLGFEKITRCTFIANRIEDTIEIIGYGFIKNDVNPKKCTCPVQKLSDSQSSIDLYLEKIKAEFKKNNLDAKELNVIYLNINFIDKKAEADVFYLRADNGKKDSAKLTIDF
jgi:hypothetical protein